MVKKHENTIFWKNVQNRFGFFYVGYAAIWSDICFPAPLTAKLYLKKIWVDLRPKYRILAQKPKVPSCKKMKTENGSVLGIKWIYQKMMKKIGLQQMMPDMHISDMRHFFLAKGVPKLSLKKIWVDLKNIFRLLLLFWSIGLYRSSR